MVLSYGACNANFREQSGMQTVLALARGAVRAVKVRLCTRFYLCDSLDEFHGAGRRFLVSYCR